MSGLKAISVRRATNGDIPVVTRLFWEYLDFYGVSFDKVQARSYLAERIAKRDCIVLLANMAPDVDLLSTVGYALVYPTFSSLSMGPVWILNDLFVTPSARGLGVGRTLVRACLHEAEIGGAMSVHLSTAHDNLAAQSLYKSEGFELDATFVSYERKIP